MTIVTIATTGQTDRAFSADTGMGEALVLAVRREESADSGETDPEAFYVNLHIRPQSVAAGLAIASLVVSTPHDRTSLMQIGDEMVGCCIRATLDDGGCAQLREPNIAATAIALRDGVLRLPRLRETPDVPMATLGEFGTHGLHHLDIYGTKLDGTPQGPFDIVRRHEGTPTYPTLWAHNADRERRLIVEPDREGRVRRQRNDHALDVWGTATRLHVNLDFRLNSQSLAACLTPEPSIGGRAWPNFRVESDPRREEALALWANNTLGLITFWWVGGRQQQGRSILTISALPSLPVLDMRELSDAQLGDAKAIFDAFTERDFLPANEAYRDETRKALDRAVLCDLLGLPETILEPLDVLREQWCAEPTVHGGKSTRPK